MPARVPPPGALTAVYPAAVEESLAEPIPRCRLRTALSRVEGKMPHCKLNCPSHRGWPQPARAVADVASIVQVNGIDGGGAVGVGGGSKGIMWSAPEPGLRPRPRGQLRCAWHARSCVVELARRCASACRCLSLAHPLVPRAQ